MSHLRYNGVDLQIERTAEVVIEPVMDPLSGLDLLYQKVRIAMVCVWNPAATTAARSVTPAVDPAPDNRLGVSIRTIQQRLMTPQQLLVFSIGPDRVFQVPGTFTVKDKPVQAPCDPAGGPFPRSCRILSVHGDKTAIVEYVIEFHVTDCGKYVLSNRWSVTSQTGEQYLTTRITEGRAVLRLDSLAVQGIVADAFRSNFTLHVPPGFIRKTVNAVATEDGREVMYRVVDQQANLNLGVNSIAVKIQGNATTGYEWPVNGAMDLLKMAAGRTAAAGAFETAWNFRRGGMPVAAAGGAAIGLILAGQKAEILPKFKANCIVRVYGAHGAALGDLAQIAVNVATDRMTKPETLGAVVPASAYVTQVFDSDGPGPIVEGRFEYLVLNTGALSMAAGITNTAMNLKSAIGGSNGIPEIARRARNFGNPPFPNGGSLPAPASNASRGTWVAFLVTQALKQGCATNAVPAADGAFPAPPGIAQPEVQPADDPTGAGYVLS